MSEYLISTVSPTDRRTNAQVNALLTAEGIRRDANLDYTCAVLDEEMNVIATGSCFGSTLRCMAVSSAHQGEGLMNQVVSHLMEVQMSRGNTHLFLYTKCSSAKFFGDLGFYEILRIPEQIVFMENRKTGFETYIKRLVQESGEAALRPGLRISALVMNANPFTLGHQYLVEQAAAESDLLHLFLVSEDASLVPFSVRRRLVQEGTAHLSNIIYHDSGPYIISNATFPSYFQKDESAVIESHARLDLTVFTRIAAALGIRCRYVGEEPASLVTGIYNQIMADELPAAGIRCVIVPRLALGARPISASDVRRAIQEGDEARLKELTPETTWRYFLSPEAEPVVARIREAGNVVHY